MIQALPLLLGVGEKLIDKFFTSDSEKAQARVKLAEMMQEGQLKELEVSMSAIVMEAKSSDPWTSRARPSFLYVMYFLLLSAIPMGVVFAVSPETAGNITTGFKDWLAAIPQEMWALFGVGYLGYVNKRSSDKAIMMGKDAPSGVLSKLLG